MIPDVSAIVVSHRSAAEAAACVASLASSFRAEGIAGETILVDCASGGEEAGALRAAEADSLLLLEENRGYSGGVNAGLAAARGRHLLLCNADVVFFAGAVGGLLRAIAEKRVGAAAPLAVWDSEGRIRLPPGFAPGFLADLGQLLAGRSPALDRARFTRFARLATRLWERGGNAPHLSGAVLAARRDVFDAAGRFDERYPFEYEETEWEERVRAEGFDLRFVPEARVRHLWAVSSSRSPETAARRAASEALYRRRYGRIGRAILAGASGGPVNGAGGAASAEPSFAATPGAAVAFSPNPSGIPFAAADLETGFRLPREISERLPAGRWLFTVYRREDGRPLETRVWERA
jgi:N-acetylglucosaminyl-diphospho-decaprenol L-rhamnosyltransferase